MKAHFGKYPAVALLLMLVLSTAAWGQKKVYTKGVRLKDFPTLTTRVVLNGDAVLNTIIRSEVASHWTMSPYEFCSPSEYEAYSSRSDNYLLHLTSDSSGIIWLTLSKGGPAESADQMKRPFDVVSIPVCGESDHSRRAVIYMDAFINAIQDYVEEALRSETVAYSGLSALNRKLDKKTPVVSDPDEADKAYEECEPGTLVRLEITPDGTPNSRVKHVLYFDASTHELVRYGK